MNGWELFYFFLFFFSNHSLFIPCLYLTLALSFTFGLYLTRQVGSHSSSHGPGPMSPSSVLSAGSFEWGYVPEPGQPSSADMIASQSQDYIDERLQEFQATIVQLQSKNTHRDLFLKSIRRNHINHRTHTKWYRIGNLLVILVLVWWWTNRPLMTSHTLRSWSAIRGVWPFGAFLVCRCAAWKKHSIC